MDSDHDEYRELLREEAKRLLELDSPALRRQAVEILDEGAEVLRRDRGWSPEELAEQVHLPPDWTQGYIDVGVRHLGQRIIELREIAGLSPAELAARSRVSVEMLRRIEEGHDSVNPTLNDLERLAYALDTNPAFLWYWAERLAAGG